MNMVASADLFKDIMVGKIGKVMDRAVEVNIFIIIAPCIFSKIIYATHGDHPIYKIGPAEKKVSTMQGAERSATNNDRRIPAGTVPDKRDHLMMNIIIELHMPDHLISGVHIVIHPALIIHAVNGKDFAFSL